MQVIIFSIAAFLSTVFGGLVALRYRDRLHRVLGYAAGVILGVVTFDVLPEIFKTVQEHNLDSTGPMVALVAGFLLFHIIEKSILLHQEGEEHYGSHHHPMVGSVSAAALSIHSFLDGVGIGLGFQVSPKVGIAVAIAVIAHDFSDGLNTVSLMLISKNSRKRTLKFLFVDAMAPVLGALSTLLFSLSATALVVYLGFFAGFLLYISSSEILPEAHREKSSYGTIGLTLAGVVFMFVVTRFI